MHIALLRQASPRRRRGDGERRMHMYFCCDVVYSVDLIPNHSTARYHCRGLSHLDPLQPQSGHAQDIPDLPIGILLTRH
jgi:hypothetical protein